MSQMQSLQHASRRDILSLASIFHEVRAMSRSHPLCKSYPVSYNLFNFSRPELFAEKFENQIDLVQLY